MHLTLIQMLGPTYTLVGKGACRNAMAEGALNKGVSARAIPFFTDILKTCLTLTDTVMVE